MINPRRNMAGYYGLENKEVIRIKVKKCDGLLQPEYKKFSIDPQITAFEMLQGILARAFNIKSDFTISYLAKAEDGQEMYLTMLSDWDMDAACQCASEPYLKLKVDLKPFEEGLEDWDIITPGDIPPHKITSVFEKNTFLGNLTGSISSQVEKTFTQMQRAIGLRPYSAEIVKPLKPAMSDMEFHNYLDSDGHLIRPQELRLSIYQGGVEPSLRKVVWRHLLNIFPEDMSGRERYDYLKKKEHEYYKLRDKWKDHFSKGTASEEIKNVISVVKKDVLRTDRTYKFYAGSDDNSNVICLFHILVTYAITHPEISYCQGMSDLASPLLVVQKDEAHAYLCFCGLMSRMRVNFDSSGRSMKIKFDHLSSLLQLYDPGFYAYLKESNAYHLFCFRWLLLELKREFPLEDALYMLEVMWSTLPPDPPRELHLTDPEYSEQLLATSPGSPSMNFPQAVYAAFFSMRFRVPSRSPPKSLNCKPSSPVNVIITTNNNGSGHYDISPMEEKYVSGDFPETDDPAAKLMQARSSSIDKSLCGTSPSPKENGKGSDAGKNDTLNRDCSYEVDSENETLFHLSLEKEEEKKSEDTSSVNSILTGFKRLLSPKRISPKSESQASTPTGSVSHSLQETLKSEVSAESGDREVTDDKTQADIDSGQQGSCGAAERDDLDKSQKLPPPQEFGNGNPFLMFLCLTILLQHRDNIMNKKLEFEEIDMYFQRMVRKHNVHSVLQQARTLYSEYLRNQQKLEEDYSSSDGSCNVSI